MNILVFGADNQLGESYCQLLVQEARNFTALRSDDSVAQDPAALKTLAAENQISQILNLSLNPGLFQSEKAIEKERKQTLLKACKQLVSLARLRQIPLIFHSSAAVFDGTNPKPYLETEVCKANNPLGKLALDLEKQVAKHRQHVIVRTEGLFSPSNPVFFQTCISACKAQNGKLTLLDQRCSPTPADDVARVLLAINKQLDCDAQTWGVFHYCALQATHRHTFVEKFLQEAAKYDEALKSCLEHLDISTLQSTKTQLENSVLDCHKIMSGFGIKQRSREAALKELVASLYRS